MSMNRHKTMSTLLSLLCLSIPLAVIAQDEDDSKSIKAERFIQGRPADKSSRSTAKYRRVTSSSDRTGTEVVAKGIGLAQIGVTIWRFRSSKPTDATKELVEEDDQQTEYTLERVEEGTALSPGQKVRLSIESLSRSGYLYVIDREQYGDGTLGDPVLIFPTQKSANANHVRAGRLVYIPSATRRFTITLTQSEKELVAEILTFIISPTPLISSERLGAKRTPLARTQVDDWQKQWATGVNKFEMDGGVGQAMTQAEQSAAREDASLLTQNDPAPQTVFELAIKPDKPVWVTVPLRFAKRN